jgi:plasmid stabilization system protein ParE
MSRETPATYSVIITETAENDLLAIVEHIASDSIDAAIHVADILRASAFSLERFPKRGAAAIEVSFEGVEARQITTLGYRIIYTINQRVVLIHAFRHHARLPISEERTRTDPPA